MAATALALPQSPRKPHRLQQLQLLRQPLADVSGAQTDALGVCWRPVSDGVYDKGKSRTNRAEAEAIIAEILRRLRNPELSCWSIGVVTFSVPQQT